jgi:hypothetical protein
VVHHGPPPAASPPPGQPERRVSPAPFKLIPGGSRPFDPEVTVPDLAKFLGVSQNYVRKDIRAGALPAVLELNGEYTITLPEVIAWLKAKGYRNLTKLAYLERVAARTAADRPAA